MEVAQKNSNILQFSQAQELLLHAVPLLTLVILNSNEDRFSWIDYLAIIGYSVNLLQILVEVAILFGGKI